MEHSNVPPSHYVNQFTRLNVSYLNEIRLESQNVGVIQRECLWCSFPLDSPVLASSPAISVDKEGEIGVIEEELAVQTLYVNGLNVLLSRHEVEGGVSLI